MTDPSECWRQLVILYKILSVQLCCRAARHQQLSAVHSAAAGHLDSKAAGDKLEKADSC